MTRATTNRNGLLAAVLVLFGVLAVALVLGGRTDNSYRVRAELKDADGLRTDGSVKVGGVTAGKIVKLSVTPRDTVVVTMDLDKSVGPIGPGASLRVRPSDLLGERFADLKLGQTQAPLPSGSLIPLTRTSAATDLDQLLDSFDADTRARIGILVNEAGIGLTGRGEALARLLETMPPNLDEARRLLGDVSTDNTRLKGLITSGDKVIASVDGHRDDLANLMTTTARALDGIARRHKELGATLAAAPSGVAQLTDTLGQLESASVSLRPVTDALRRTAAPLTNVLRTLPTFSSSATDALHQAVAVAPSIERLGRRATAPVKRLTPTADGLAKVLDEARPSLKQIDDRAMKDLLWFVQNWSLAMRGRDSIGHFLGGEMSISSDLFQQLLDDYLRNTSSSATKRKRAASGLAPLLTLPATSDRGPLRVRAPKAIGTVTKEIGGIVQQTISGVTQTAPAAGQSAGQVVRNVTGLLGHK